MSDGYEIRGRFWPAANADSDLAFVYLHGIQSHGGWFEWSAALLAGSGHGVLLADRRGSGMNAEQRGDTPSADRWLADIRELGGWLNREHRARRIGLIGVSWGGKLAVAYTISSVSAPGLRAPPVERLLLIAPGISPAVDVTTGTKLAIAWSLATRSTRLFEVPLSDPALFTGNPAARRYIADDPMKIMHATARFFAASKLLDRRLATASRGALRVPVTVLLAEKDRIIRNDATENRLRRLSGQELRVVRFPDTQHTLEFEPDTRTFADVLSDWARGREPAGVAEDQPVIAAGRDAQDADVRRTSLKSACNRDLRGV
jgi:alpha-beta hydrolase superfamily lysophospholipase